MQHELSHFYLLILTLLVGCSPALESNAGKSIITTWQSNKKAAISLTYDDGTINQFTVARPIMNALDFPATFYIITGKITGSAKGKFIGRPIKEIITESGSIKTNEKNFFERASAIGFTGSAEAVNYHSRAGSLYEAEKIEEAYQLIDEGYEKLRNGELILVDEPVYHDNKVDTTTWEDFRAYAKEGHEIASHTVTHPRLAVLDEPNLLYELEQSRADIIKFLGEEYTFSAECPYGTEDERVMEYAHKIYPALRNRMPEDYLDELNRSSDRHPGASTKELVQWQRGPLTNVSMETMKAWVDTCLAHQNIWLVLVFHGVDGIGWEPRTGSELEEYFNYIKAQESELWVATFADVTKYIRERKNIELTSELAKDKITITMNGTLDPAVYNIPVTIKTYLPLQWKSVSLQTNTNLNTNTSEIMQDSTGNYVFYTVPWDEKEIVLTENK